MQEARFYDGRFVMRVYRDIADTSCRREDQGKVGGVKNRGMWEMARNKRTIRMKPPAAARGRAYRRLR